MKLLFCFVLTLLSTPLNAQISVPEAVVFNTADGGSIHADYYPGGTTAVVLAHGAIFNKESWRELAAQLITENISTLAIDLRGYGHSKGGSRPADRYEDILAAVRYLNQQGLKEIAVLGASMGGGAAGKAAVHARRGAISRLLLLSSVPIAHPEQMQAGRILFIASRNEGSIAAIKAQYRLAPKPKQLKLLKGDAHAQHIFKTAEKAALTESIIHFLKAR